MPDLAVVDGIIGVKGDSLLNGTPKPMGQLVPLQPHRLS